MTEPTWVRKPPRKTLRSRWHEATDGVSWFTVFCMLLTLAGLLEGGVAVFYASWLALGFGGLLELAAVNCFLLASREDQ